MPWTAADVDSHKKGLSAKQKRQWVHIANSMYASCMDKGGSDETCAPRAIRAANGSVGKSAAEESMETHDESQRTRIVKIDTDQHLVFGWASVAIRKDGEQVVDLQDDVIDPDELEQAAYSFNLDFRAAGVNHEGESVGQLIESLVVTKEKLLSMGLEENALPQGWWVGFYVEDDAVFDKIKDGTYTAFSIQGHALREPIP